MGAPGQPRADAGNRDLIADGLDRMIALAEQAGHEETWAWDALSRFVEGCVELGLDPLLPIAGTPAPEAGTTHGATVAHEATVTPEVNVTPGIVAGRARLLEELGRIVGAAHAEGALRLDVGPGDVIGVVGLLMRGVLTLPAELGEDLRDRAVRLALAGMRNHPAPAPPGRPLSADELLQRLT
ncbi:hypothetical protein GCM10009733_066810 [Nonomuraea maheshkhaliensis]|uniref:TetR/AcrR family transcriptional regulator n=1 Tax=Nonomuraea maheshkhaliensis TaxID=419590 RepID=A0ABN2FUY6_9ACTN